MVLRLQLSDSDQFMYGCKVAALRFWLQTQVYPDQTQTGSYIVLRLQLSGSRPFFEIVFQMRFLRIQQREWSLMKLTKNVNSFRLL